MPFEVKIRRARFVVPGYQPAQMLKIAEKTNESIGARISAGLNVADSPAPPLSKRGGKGGKKSYASRKAKQKPPAIRNWILTGWTMQHRKVLLAAHNKAQIGFTDPLSNMRAAINNARHRQFGMSPSDDRALAAALRSVGSPVKVEQQG